MWVVAALFTIRDSVWLLVAGCFLYMVLIPFIEAAEQTMLQRVVPLAKQGRVFGFAASDLSAHEFASVWTRRRLVNHPAIWPHALVDRPCRCQRK